ncbi:MAG: hypothetical protein L3J75_15395, partial [Methylococcaceae bacterium]|nr:hypothetical protein [Methylococcaceae bacterium]
GTLAAYDRFEQAKDLAAAEGRSAEFFGDMAGGAVFEVGSILVPVGLVAKAGKLGKVASVADDVADAAKTAKKVENAEDVFGATQKAKAASVNPVINEFDDKVSPIQRCPVADADVGVKKIKLTYPVETKPNEAFFWSGRTNGRGGENIARKIAEENNGTTLEALIEKRNIEMPKWDTTNPEVVKAWKDISADYAKGSTGTVRAVIGEDLRPGNVWEVSELPALKKNPNVEKIITIDPVTKVETVLFTRGIQ